MEFESTDKMTAEETAETPETTEPITAADSSLEQTDDAVVPAATATEIDGEEDGRLKPRAYQRKLFDRAIHQNVIAVLDTGSGKTLISVMLIKHMAALKRQRQKVRAYFVNQGFMTM